MLVGYMRVSSDGDRQVLDFQRNALLAVGALSQRRWSPVRFAASRNYAITRIRPQQQPRNRPFPTA